jgi:hypothetical protein
MARLVLEPGWIEVKAGCEFYHEGLPSSGFMPLNASARAAKLRSIDRHWRDNPRPEAIRRLAKSLGFDRGTDADAVAAIEKFIRETEMEAATS